MYSSFVVALPLCFGQGFEGPRNQHWLGVGVGLGLRLSFGWVKDIGCAGTKGERSVVGCITIDSFRVGIMVRLRTRIEIELCQERRRERKFERGIDTDSKS